MFTIKPKDKSLIAVAISQLIYLAEMSQFRWEVRPTLTKQDGIDYMDLYIWVGACGHKQEEFREVEAFFQMNWTQTGKICAHCVEQKDMCHECGLDGDCGWYGSTESCPAYKRLAICGHLNFESFIDRD